MGLLTAVELETELYYALDSADEFDPSTPAGAANCLRALNFSYMRLQLPSVFDHIEKQTTQAIVLATGTGSYPITLRELDHIRYNNIPRRLKPFNIRRRSQGLQSPGSPTRYARWGSSIYLDFIPTLAENGHTLTAYGWAEPTQLVTSSGAASILNSVWDEVILVGGKWRGWRRLGEGVKADMHREEYAAMVNDNKSVLQAEAFDQGFAPEIGTAADYQITW